LTVYKTVEEGLSETKNFVKDLILSTEEDFLAGYSMPESIIQIKIDSGIMDPLIDKVYLEGSTYGNLDPDCMGEQD